MEKKTQTDQKKLLIGAHVSIAGGVEKSIERTVELGANTMQIFTKSNRQWESKPLSQESIKAFKDAVKIHNISPVVTHASYLINIGSPNQSVAQRSLEALILELERCDQLGVDYLVLHPGSHCNTDESNCLIQIASNINTALDTYKGKTTLLLEIMAGQGSVVCYKLEHFQVIFKHLRHDTVGVCFDTAHAFAAGYDLTTQQSYEQFWQEFNTKIGIEKIKAIHLNDSKKECGSRVDRHEDIGKGKMGLEAFALLINDARFASIPKILETPKETAEDDKRNIATIRKLVSGAK